MAEATITISSGSQTSSITIPDAAVQRLLPMILDEYRPLHPGEDPTVVQSFLAGIRSRVLWDLRKYERGQFSPEPIDIGGDPDEAK